MVSLREMLVKIESVSKPPVKFLEIVYRKSTFSGVCTHFDSFLPNTYKIGMMFSGMVYLVNVSLTIDTLTEIFQKNCYPENFIDRYFKLLFLNRIHILK